MTQQQKEAVEILNQHGITPPALTDITITKRSVYEPMSSHRMSDEILDKTFPKSGTTDAIHFTLPHVLPSILKHRHLWLAPVARNLAEGEYQEFGREHGFAGAQLESIRRELAECYFYASFSPVGTSAEANHWSDFAAGGLGYCLRFRLEPGNADLRRVQYSGGEKRLYTRINDAMRNRIGKTLVPWGYCPAERVLPPQDLRR